MDKSYFFALDSSGFILSVFYCIGFVYALIYLSKRLKVSIDSTTISIFFIYYYLFFIISTFSPFVPDLSDTKLFSNMVVENFYPDYQSLGVRLFYWMTYPLRILSLFKIELFILFQLFFFTLSLLILWKSWQIVLEKNNLPTNLGSNLYMILAAFYPAFLLYIPVPLREFFVLFGFSIMLYGIVDKYYNNHGMLYILLGSGVLLFGRPQLIVIVVIFLALFQKNKWIKFTLIGASVFLIPYLFTHLTSFKFTPSYFEYLRNLGAHKHGNLGYGVVEWKTYWDIVYDSPKLFLQFILSPFPFAYQGNPLHFFAIFIDALFSLVIYLSVLYSGFKVSKIYLFIFLLSGGIFSVWEFHIAGAVRHRMPLVAILLPVASYGLLKFYQDIRKKS